MNTTVKAMLTATALCAAGLCLSVSNTVDAAPNNSDFNLIIVNKYTSVSSSDTDLLPSTDLFTTETFAQMFDKPLVKIPLDDIPSYRVNKVGKTSELFAISSLLNDKLQQLIAKFTQSSPSYSVNEEGEMALNKVETKTCNLKRS